MQLTAFSNMLHKLRCVEQKLTKEFEKITGFSITRYEMLAFLKDNGDSLQRDIAGYLDIDPAAVTRHIKILEKNGYITRERNEDNGREVIVSLTEFAKDKLEKCRVTQRKEGYNLPVSFTQKEIRKLSEILEEIDNRLA
ncbi:MarR family winged helix-turn-helix transcriptional regulator [Fusobacterium sp.]|uniref:MarR family winged helix-turn-helix transcriptional regulator n=1 Tax=Fusobacterium sp. TaxID=68766 RepID=UPI00396D018B